MKLNVDLTELHKAASRMSPTRNVSVEDAYIAGKASISEGESLDNCHYSYFATTELSSSWENGRQDQLEVDANE